MSIPEAATARDLARELHEPEMASATDAARLADAMQRVCIHISEKLRRSVGDEGYVALLEHVVAAMEHDHRVVLKDIWRTDAAEIHLHVASAVESRGAATVNAALESLLAALHEREAATTSRRAIFLASTGRELVMSLDDAGVLEVIRQRTLLREGSWCIVDVVE